MASTTDNEIESALPKHSVLLPDIDEHVMENQKEESDAEDDEEVLKVMDSTDVIFEDENISSPELVQTSDDEHSFKFENSPKLTEEQNATVSDNVGEDKPVGGLINNGHYSRLLFVGDFRLHHLEKTWPLWHYVKPQFLFERELTINGIKDFILSRTELPHLENGTLLMCSVGIHDIIAFTDHEVCKASEDLTPMQVMILKEKSVEDLIRLVMMKLDKASSILEELLDSSSIVCFAAIIPCDPIMFFMKTSEKHNLKSHADISSKLRKDLMLLKNKIKLVCDRVNKQLAKLAPLPSFWDIMVSYHRDQHSRGCVFQDGLNISHRAAGHLSHRLNKFLQELFYGVEIHKGFLEFSSKQEIIVVGDSRLKEIQNMWSGDMPTFYCEPEMGFYNLEQYITEHFVGLKNKIVLVCLGLNDLVKFIDDDEFPCENHNPIKRVISLCHKYERTPQTFVEKILGDIEKAFYAFRRGNSSLMFFATVYPIHIDIYWNHQLDVHKKNTGHIITPPENISKLDENLKEVVSLLNHHLRCISQNLLLPVWDMYNIVCRGEEATSLSQDVLKDGIFPSERTSEELIRLYHRFLNTKLCQDSKEDKGKYKYPERSKTQPKIKALQVSGPEKSLEKEKKETALLSGTNFPSLEDKSSRDLEGFVSTSHDHKESRESLSKDNRSSPVVKRSIQSSEKDQNSVRNRLSYRNIKSRHSRSPERFSRSSRSPRSDYKVSRYSQYPREDSQYLDDYKRRARNSDSKGSFYSRFFNLQDSMKRQCYREERPRIRDALSDLHSSHVRECEMYLKKPDAHPDYAREYRLFLEKKKYSIYELGGDPASFDFISAWGDFWPGRMLELFEEAWKIKKDQCIRLLISKKRRSSSSSSSSSNETKIRSKGSPKHVRSKDSIQKNNRPLEYRDKWQQVAAESSQKRTGQQVARESSQKRTGQQVARESSQKRTRQLVAAESSQKTVVDFVRNTNVSLVKPQVKETISTEPLMPQYSNKVDAHHEKPKIKSRKVVEVFSVLAYMKDKLGVFGMPVNVLYEKAVELQKRGLDPNQILDNEETVMLLGMLNDKLRSLLEEEELSAIQKAIYIEAQSHLQELQKEYKEIKLKCSPKIKVNIHKLARLTMGKSIPETIEIISSLLLYEGYYNVSRMKLEAIYMDVKDEQLKINHSVDKTLPEKRSDHTALFEKARQLNQSHNAYTPESELTEEFFIGKKLHTNLDDLMQCKRETSLSEGMFSKASTSYASHSEGFSGISKPELSLNHSASSAKFYPPSDYDEEFFTGRKFGKLPSDEHVHKTYTPEVLPHKQLMIPPPPIIGNTSQQSKSPRIEIDFEAIKSCLTALKKKSL